MPVIGCVLPDLRSVYGLTDTFSGALLSCYSLGNLASGIVINFVSVRLGRKTAIISLTFLLCLGMMILVSAYIPAMLLMACVLIGLGRGSLITFSQGGVNFVTGGRPATTVMLHAVFAVGAIISPLMFSFLRPISWQAGIIIVIIMALIAISLFMTMGKLPRGNKHQDSEWTFLKYTSFMIIAGLMFLYLCCESAVNGWLVTYMTHKNMSMSFSQSMPALMWVIMLIGRLTCAVLASRIPMKKMLLVMSAASALSFGLMLISSGKASIIMSVSFIGLCMSGISPVIYASSAPYTNKYPASMGVLFTIGCLGGTLMPLITGIIAENYGFDGGMSAILVAFVLLMVFAVIHYRRDKE